MSPSSFKTYNPFSGEFLGEHQFASETDVEKAIIQLSLSFRDWKSLSFHDRQKILKPCADYLFQNKHLLAKSITAEMGKPISQSFTEINKSIEAIHFLCDANYDDLLQSEIKTRLQNSTHHIFFKPKGIVLGIMPWNFPLWQAIRMIFPALLVGNTILFKHSEITPSVGLFLNQMFDSLQFKNIFSHQLFQHTLTEQVIADSRIQGLSFTGSTNTGLLLSSYAGRYMKKSVFELGGSDAYLVLKDADLNLAAKSITQARLQNSGQSCIAAKRVFVHKTVADELQLELAKCFSEYKFGDVYSVNTQLGPLAHVRFKKDDEQKFLEISSACEVLYQYNPDDDWLTKQAQEKEFQAFAPVRILKVKIEKSKKVLDFASSHEFFSPTLLVFEFQQVDEALSMINSSDFGLGGAVFSRDEDRAVQIAKHFQSGMVAVNDFIKSDVELPFGGVKLSGHGRELGSQGFLEFTDMQLISIKKT